MKNSITLEKLLSKSSNGAPLPDDLKDWEKMKPVGIEFGSELTDDELDDLELSKIFDERKNQPEIKVDINEL